MFFYGVNFEFSVNAQYWDPRRMLRGATDHWMAVARHPLIDLRTLELETGGGQSRDERRITEFQLPKGTYLSAVDEHRKPNHLGGGKFEFHGNFELRAMLPSDIPAAAKAAGHMPAAELMSHAPMEMTAQGVD